MIFLKREGGGGFGVLAKRKIENQEKTEFHEMTLSGIIKKLTIISNNLLKWKWLVFDIFQAAKFSIIIL